MTTKLTQQEAELKIANIQRDGYCGKLIDVYNGNHGKYRFECQKCGNVFIREFNHVCSDKAIFCLECAKILWGKKSRIKDSEIKKRIANIKVDGYSGKYLRGYCGLQKSAWFKCPICQKEFRRRPDDVIHWKLIFCKPCGIKRRTIGHTMSQKRFEEKCKKIGAIPLEPYGKNVEQKIKWKCTQCGKSYNKTPHEIFGSKSLCTTMCIDCSRNNRPIRTSLQEAENRDKQVGAIPIGKFRGTNYNRKYQCTKCGKTFMRQPDCVWRLKQIDCLKCSRQYLISSGAKKILHILKNILQINGDDEDFLEQRIPGWQGGIDILIDNIAIEFDGYYWHRQHQNGIKREKRKDKAIIKAGYKRLRIRSCGIEIPTEDQLRKVLFNHFQHGYNKWTITLPSWKQAEKKHQDQ